MLIDTDQPTVGNPATIQFILHQEHLDRSELCLDPDGNLFIRQMSVIRKVQVNEDPEERETARIPLGQATPQAVERLQDRIEDLLVLLDVSDLSDHSAGEHTDDSDNL